MTKNNFFPKNWDTKPLEKLIEVAIGGDWGKDLSYEDLSYEIAYCIRGSEIKNWDEDKGKTASLRKLKKASIENRRLTEGDILVEISGGGPEQPVGRTVLIDKAVLNFEPNVPKVCTNFLRLLRPVNNIHSKFLNLYLKYFYKSGEIIYYQGGSNNLRNLKFPNYIKINVPIPPFQEQQQIVNKIEELFSEIDKGIEQLKTARQQLKTYRQAVLKWAFEGKLTEEWRKENSVEIKSGHDILRDIDRKRTEKLNESISNGNKESSRIIRKIKEHKFKEPVHILPREWSWTSFLTACYLVVDCHNKTAPYENEGIFLVRTSNIKDGKLLLDKQIKFVSKKTYQYWSKRCPPESGDILFTREAPMGESAIIPNDTIVCMGQRMMLLRAFPELLSTKYLHYAMMDSTFLQRMNHEAIGTGVKHLRVGDVEGLVFPICSPQEQSRIVEEIESRISIADKMEESISQSLQQAEVLRQSILKKAFEGKLVQTETEPLIKVVVKETPAERKVLAGKIIYLLHDIPRFGSTRFQKVLFVTEYFAEMEYETHYLQETAGPYDRDFTVAFKKEMKEKDWFDEETLRGGGTRFLVGENVSSLIADYPKYFREKGEQIRFVLELMKDCDTHEAELTATLYAVWNNRLIQKKPVNIALLTEDFFRWSVKKEREFLEQEIRERYEWMKKVGLVPRGFGKVV